MSKHGTRSRTGRHAPKDSTEKIRVTEVFKKILEKESTARRRSGRQLWSKSDILHLALANYIQSRSLHWHEYTEGEKQAILENLMP